MLQKKCPVLEKSLSIRFSTLKTLFLCFFVELIFFFLTHFFGDGSDMSIELFRGSSSCVGLACIDCLLLVWAIPVKVSWFSTSKAQSFLHCFFAFFNCYGIYIHCVWVSFFPLEVPVSSWFFLFILWGSSKDS